LCGQDRASTYLRLRLSGVACVFLTTCCARIPRLCHIWPRGRDWLPIGREMQGHTRDFRALACLRVTAARSRRRDVCRRCVSKQRLHIDLQRSSGNRGHHGIEGDSRGSPGIARWIGGLVPCFMRRRVVARARTWSCAVEPLLCRSRVHDSGLCRKIEGGASEATCTVRDLAEQDHVGLAFKQCPAEIPMRLLVAPCSAHPHEPWDIRNTGDLEAGGSPGPCGPSANPPSTPQLRRKPCELGCPG
jgi:hypothetical protein